MPRTAYSKPAKTYSEQVGQLESRGLKIENKRKALHLLENLSYYRLSGYWYPMLGEPKKDHVFKPNSTFERSFKIYCFDREFRKFIMSEIEKIEVAVRAQMIYTYSHAHGAFWFKDVQLFQNGHKHQKSIERFKKEFDDSKEQFIIQFKNNYNNQLPPSWMLLEIVSFGSLSTLFSNLRPGLNKRAVANYFGLDEATFESWLHSLVYVRNICAHHSRLWNRSLAIQPVLPIVTQNKWLGKTRLPNHTITGNSVHVNSKTYCTLSILIYFLNTINPNHSIKERLYALLRKYPMIDVGAMGFPDGWKNEVIWGWNKIEKWHHRNKP